jgi:hypothetical protein
MSGSVIAIVTLPTLSPPPQRKTGSLPLRIAAIVWGVLCVLLALQWFVELGMSGFPDGYISPYARATSVPLHILATACLVQGVYFLIKGAIARNLQTGSLGLQILAAAIITIAPVLVLHNCPRSQACSDAYQALTGTMMDDGQGG